MNRHLAIDIGSESGRAFVGYIKDEKIVLKEIHRFKTQDFLLNNRRARNFYRYHEEIQKGLKIYAEKYGEKLESIGVDAWGGDFILLDRKGNIARLPSFYRDCALSDMSTVIEQKYGQRKLYAKTGNAEMRNDTLQQILRLQEENEPSIDDPRAILFVADAFHYLLGGKICCEHSLASYCRFFNNLKNDWDDEILDTFGIPGSIKTPVVYAGETIGTVNREILDAAGITGEVKIITPCSHDTACAALAIADLGDDWAFISSGTWSLMGFETPAPVITDKSWSNNFSNSSMPLRTNMFKKNVTGTWIIQQCKEKWNKYTYDEIVNLAEQAADKECFVNVDAPELFFNLDMPLEVCKLVKRDFGMEIDPDDVGTVARICFQSLALRYKYFLEKLVDAADKSVSRIYIVGGGSRNRLINQFTANATGYPVFTGVYEGSTVGNILLQAYGYGEIKSKTEMRQIVCNTFPQTVFEPQFTEEWNRKYELFLAKVPCDNKVI